MTASRLAVLVLVAWFAVGGPAPAQPAALREVHGALDAYADEGVSLAWAILRGRDVGAAKVVVRVDADPSRYHALAVAGVDPFTGARVVLMAFREIGGAFDFVAPRADFADHPRTEWRFFGDASAGPDARPALLVFYQGVPDTAPEFDEPAKLGGYLGERIARARDDARKGRR